MKPQDRMAARGDFYRQGRQNAGMAILAALALLLTACSQGRITGGPSATATATPAATATPLSTIDPPVTLAQMAYDSHTGTVVLFGGVSGGANSEATWIWSGAGWHRTQTATAPDVAKNVGSALVYDSTHDQVLFFEYVNSATNQNAPQTWTFDGTNWTERAVSPIAPALGALLADDPAGGGVLAFGGITGYSANGAPIFGTATWRWDGTRWALLHPATAPTASNNNFGVMTTDANTRQAVLVNQHTGVVWTWDGTTWTAHQPASVPPAHDSGSLVFDGQTQTVLLVGGADHASGQPESAMWQWNGSTWSQLSVAGTPTFEPVAVVYDAQMHVLITYVGQTDQTLIWDGGSMWRQVA